MCVCDANVMCSFVMRMGHLSYMFCVHSRVCIFLCVRSLVCVFYVFVHVFVYFVCLFTCLCIFMCLFV